MALSGHTVFTTYLLVPSSSLSEGNSKFIHCNYIKSLQLTTDPDQMEVVINFSNIRDFKFLSNDINNGTGYTANKIYALVQLIANSGYTAMTDVKPIASEWRMYNITSGITTHFGNNALTPAEMVQQAFKIPLRLYSGLAYYNLHNYITYPTPLAENELGFGDETFFLGNVSTDIKAVSYTLDIPIVLDLNQFNSSTNSTWNSETDKVSISEIGIYDVNKNLVAIGKLNNPIQKDTSTARTIVFAIDF
jgi:hypothetical protein